MSLPFRLGIRRSVPGSGGTAFKPPLARRWALGSKPPSRTRTASEWCPSRVYPLSRVSPDGEAVGGERGGVDSNGARRHSVRIVRISTFGFRWRRTVRGSVKTRRFFDLMRSAYSTAIKNAGCRYRHPARIRGNMEGPRKEHRWELAQITRPGRDTRLRGAPGAWFGHG